jgi:hypothetical protein
MMQRYLLNKHEIKVTCINGRPLHHSHKNYSENRRKFPDKADDEFLFTFAKSAIDELKSACPEFLCSGITRVDIMYCQVLEEYYVNEVESLEAGFDTRHRKFTLALLETQQFLGCYHYDILKDSVLEIRNRMHKLK